MIAVSLGVQRCAGKVVKTARKIAAYECWRLVA